MNITYKDKEAREFLKFLYEISKLFSKKAPLTMVINGNTIYSKSGNTEYKGTTNPKFKTLDINHFFTSPAKDNNFNTETSVVGYSFNGQELYDNFLVDKLYVNSKNPAHYITVKLDSDRAIYINKYDITTNELVYTLTAPYVTMMHTMNTYHGTHITSVTNVDLSPLTSKESYDTYISMNTKGANTKYTEGYYNVCIGRELLNTLDYSNCKLDLYKVNNFDQEAYKIVVQAGNDFISLETGYVFYNI